MSTHAIERPNKENKLSLFSKGKELQFTSHPSASGPTIVKAQKDSNPDLVFAKPFKIEEILEEIKKAKENTGNQFTRASKGYISLMNYINDTQTRKRGKQQFNPSKGYSTDAELTIKNEDRYIPQSWMKRANVWEDESFDAFQYSVNMLLNRLTEGQLESTISQLEQHIKEDKHIAYTATFIVEKAQIEHAFAPLYAKFIKNVSVSKLRDRVLNKTIDELDDFLINVPSTEEEALKAKGTSKFLSSIISNGILEQTNALNKLTDILKKLKETGNENIVGMLETFVMNSEKEFVLAIKPEQWAIFDECLKNENPSTYKGCMLLNIQELREQIINNRQTTRKVVAETKTADEVIEVIRNLYCDFTEGTKLADITVEANQFLQTALHQLPDHVKDAACYATFLGHAIPKCKPSATKQYAQICTNYSTEITEQKIAEEYPKIWQAFFKIIVGLFTFGHISKEKATAITQTFPEAKDAKVNFLEEAKWFLYDNYDFHHPFKPQSVAHEILDALTMPEQIDNRDQSSPLSRLIAVATCRVVVNKVVSQVDKSDEIIQRYSKLLSQIAKKLPDVIEEEINIANEEYGFPYSYEELSAKIH